MNKKDEFIKKGLENGFNSKSDDSSWLIGMALVSSLFSDKAFSNQKLNSDIESRIAKLEAKTEILEKIVLD